MVEIESDGAIRVSANVADSWTACGYSQQTLVRMPFNELAKLYWQRGFKLTLEKVEEQ